MTPSKIDIAALGLGDGSGLGIRESLRPIENGQRRRTINGVLRNTGRPEFRLYELELSSDDVQPPALGNLWPGSIVSVVPISEIGVVVPAWQLRFPVTRALEPSSVRGRLPDGRPLRVDYSASFSTFTLPAMQSTPVRIYYRPRLTMMVVDPWSQDESETGGPLSTSWSIRMQEVAP